MKALILNSGLGRRMGNTTKNKPKCMTKISEKETIVSRQLNSLNKLGLKEIIMTTGPFENNLIEYCNSLKLNSNIRFVNNPIYDKTNYIYSIYCAEELLDDDILMMHGDLIFDEIILKNLLNSKGSYMTVSTSLPLSEKDFKAVIKDNKIEKIGINYFSKALAAQPLYKLNRNDWLIWLNSIIDYCESGITNCYAENAFNDVSNKCIIKPYDIENLLCMEVDNLKDLDNAKDKLKELQYVKKR